VPGTVAPYRGGLSLGDLRVKFHLADLRRGWDGAGLRTLALGTYDVCGALYGLNTVARELSFNPHKK
jgi:hypothetical protein